MSARWRAIVGIALVAAVAVALAPTAFAQTDVTPARISGVVRHTDGSALPGVVIEAKNQDTGLVATATTRGDGSYQIVNLPTGRNSYRQPSFYSLDLRIQKAFRLGPGDISMALDCFNCTNTGNKFVSQTTFGRVPNPNHTQTPNAGFGNANNPGTPRTLQVSARYDF